VHPTPTGVSIPIPERVANPSPEYTTSTRTFWPFLDFLRARGHDLDALLAGTGYSERELREPDRRLVRSQSVALMEAALSVYAGPALGLAVARFVTPETFDLVEYASRSSATVGDAIQVVNRYARLADDSAAFELQPLGDRVLWRLQMVWPPVVDTVAVDYLLGIIWIVSLRLFGQDAPRGEIWLQRPAAADQSYYEKLMILPVRFAATVNGLLFPAEALERSLPAADPTLTKLLQRQADELLSRLPRVESIGDQVRRVIQEELRAGEPSMEQIARRLATTSSTLRRRLSAEGQSFRELLESTRLELARAYLADPRLSITEVAFRLGFRDASTFFKSFKRWTGKTPADYRRGLV
jgi:AraC-like DNA-binding protein